MGTVYADITIKNLADLFGIREGRLKEQDLRSITVRAVVDTGASSLVINEEQCQTLGLGITDEKNLRLANGGRADCKLTEPVDIYWKDRHWACSAVVLPGAELVLLGAIPLEGMDLMINPKTQELIGVHGDVAELWAL